MKLRHEVEHASVQLLPQLVGEAVGLTDQVCWDALEHEDVNGFGRYAEVGAALLEFSGECRPCARALLRLAERGDLLLLLSESSRGTSPWAAFSLCTWWRMSSTISGLASVVTSPMSASSRSRRAPGA